MKLCTFPAQIDKKFHGHSSKGIAHRDQPPQDSVFLVAECDLSDRRLHPVAHLPRPGDDVRTTP